MKNYAKLAALLLIAAGSFYSCQEKEPDENNEPIEIPVTEYSLAGTSCQWANLSYDGTVIIINSNAALESYLTNARSGGYPAIDFSKYSLLLVSGATDNGVVNVTVQNLQKLTAINYELSVEITLNTAIAGGEWVIALVTDKLSGDKRVELKVSYKDCEDCEEEVEYPIDIPFTDYSLAGTSCQWKPSENLNGEIIIINSNEELGSYITCSGGSCPAVDFSKHTLLLTRGISSSGISNSSAKKLTRLEQKHYELEVELELNNLTVETPWQVAIVTDKIDGSSNVEVTTVDVIGNCTFNNPLTDLPWLKDKVDEITLIIQNGNPLSVSIYQCIYGNNETGFLIDEGNTKPFYNCNGDILCIMGGFAGETCSELNIVSEELIWEINN